MNTSDCARWRRFEGYGSLGRGVPQSITKVDRGSIAANENDRKPLGSGTNLEWRIDAQLVNCVGQRVSVVADVIVVHGPFSQTRSITTFVSGPYRKSQTREGRQA